MKEERLNKSVLAMYDVRGIQDYIFRTNYVKEIIGASAMVENIILDGMKAMLAEKREWNKDCFLLDWEAELKYEETIFGNAEVQMQVLFIGGGNAYVLFKNGSVCKEVNRYLSKYVLEQTYSLQLAVAVVEYTGSYQQDYLNINEEMWKVKARMPKSMPLGAQPFMAADTATGYPLTKYHDGRYLSTESYRKRKKYEEIFHEDAEKILDNMVTEKGDSSMLAVVHIDGNNMGKRIKEIMEGKDDYLEAVRAMRTISVNIREGFQAAFWKMAEYIDQKLSDRIRADRKGKLYRKLILAGDDVTFICNALAAMDAVSVFLKSVGKRRMYEEAGLTEEENQKKYGFSACAGIAFFNSHFPFCDAYEVAEACCSNAKKRAKLDSSRDAAGNTGSFLDYQLCTHISAADLGAYRDKHYVSAEDGTSILMRPYYVKNPVLDGFSDMNRVNETYDLEILRRTVESFQKNMPRSHAKKMRDHCVIGKQAVEEYLTFVKSRKMPVPEANQAYWYDALEMMDFFLKDEEVQDETEDNAAE
ncbi:MAG: hypothetical protein Q4E24_01325 [bacterium]|nr:hypothetical protein [bacterium]